MAASNRLYTPRSGGRHHLAKLSDAEVSLVRTMRSVDGTGYRKLAAVFGVGQTTIAQICRNERRVGANRA